MDTDKIKEVMKNISIKGDLNSETVEKISKDLLPKLMPYLWLKEFLDLFSWFMFVSGACLVAKIIADAMVKSSSF